ncbi:cytochrome c biogenesis protein CcsA [Candidatus Oleimmundimicrobium sp.]|uniref:cytochrome c biogenesis protein CcsA n=1 Tax=Candidatus Oleimmundimicrobium sp. TaxID=3060597 RepID=UPI00272257C5|nr:cytochrome c biogenesis protein CcsA [Candidatus Oleimmundimicrobium sp.]MDO8885937.1 cytochrome c biogenesis protein CcsA [Candidatus Oleimmundimicrobium sp.]
MEKVSVVLFWLAALAYAAGFALYASHFISRRQITGTLATAVTVCGGLIQTGSLFFRWLSSKQSLGASAYESLAIVVWFVIIGYLVLERFADLKTLGMFVTSLACIFLIKAWSYYHLPGPRMEVLQGSFISAHFMSMFVASAAFAIAAGAAILYLLQEWHFKRKKSDSILARLPSLQVLDDVGYKSVIVGFLFLTTTLITGAIRAYQIWGTFFDAIVIATFLTWVIYVFYLVLRVAAGWMGKRSAILALVGFLFVISIRFLIVPYMSFLHGFKG